MNFNKIIKTFSTISLSAALIVSPTIAGAASVSVKPEVAIQAAASNNYSYSVNPYYWYPLDGSQHKSIYVKDASKNRYIELYSNGDSKNIKPQIQIYNSNKKAWETKTTAKYSSTSKGVAKYSYNLSFLKSEGKYQMRYYVPNTYKTSKYYSKTSTANIMKESYGYLSLGSPKKAVNYNSSIGYKLSVNKSVKYLDVQTYNSKTKKWVKTSRIYPKNGSVNWNIKHPKKAVTETYRLYYPGNTTHSPLISNNVKVKFAKGKSTVVSKTPIDVSKLSTKTKDKVGVYVHNSPNLRVYIQSYDAKKKKWVNRTSAKAGNTLNTQKVMIPYPKLSGNQRLRIAISGDSNFDGSASKTRAVNYINPNSYKGTAKTTYNYVKKWCPGVTIDVKGLKKGTAGTAVWPTNHINISKSIKGLQLKDTSIHECGHILQLNAFNEDTNALNKRANAVYGKDKRGSGVEKQADCIVQYLTGNSLVKYSYYKNYKKCTSKELAAAKKVVQGKRF